MFVQVQMNLPPSPQDNYKGIKNPLLFLLLFYFLYFLEETSPRLQQNRIQEYVSHVSHHFWAEVGVGENIIAHHPRSLNVFPPRALRPRPFHPSWALFPPDRFNSYSLYLVLHFFFFTSRHFVSLLLARTRLNWPTVSNVPCF